MGATKTRKRGRKSSQEENCEKWELDTLLHTVERTHECSLCGKVFSCRSVLSRHVRNHARNTLDEHSKTRTTDGKSSVSKAKPDVQTKTRSGAKPYQCSICGKYFSDDSTLMKHQVSHIGERPYECTTCGRRFNISAHLTAHKKIHARIKKQQQ